MPRALAVCLLFALAGCKVNEETKLKAIIGAVLIDGNGGPPITDSVVVVSGSRIRSAGVRANVPIPAGSDKINGSGKFLLPGLIDLDAKLSGGNSLNGYLYNGVTAVRSLGPDLESLFTLRKSERDGALLAPRLFLSGPAWKATDADQAARQVAERVAQQVDGLFIPAGANPSVADAILEEARKYNLPVTADIATLADAGRLVDSGVAGFLHVFRDTEDADAAFLSKLRSLKIVFTPALGEPSGLARRNTRRLAAAGVPIGVGSGGAGIHRQLQLLAEAGLSPLELTTAATRNGALALRRLDELGTIEPGKRADFLLLNANPIEDVGGFEQIDQMMLNGEWVDRAALKK